MTDRTMFAAAFLAVAAMAATTLFYGLGDLPLVLWDESRLANSAIEMLAGGDPLVTTYGGEPDTWNTKPPLQIWLMVTAMAIIGPSEWAMRLPSALAALLTTALVGWFAARVTGNRYAGLLSAAVLVSTPGVVGVHVARTADYDSLLVLWTTLAVVSCHCLAEGARAEGRLPVRWVALLGASLSLGILTKGIAPLLLVPGLALHLLVRGVLPRLASDRRVWLIAAVALVPSLAFYLLREFAGPGYLTAVWQNEIGGRYANALEGNDRPADYYLRTLFRIRPGWHGSGTPWSQAFVLAVVPALLVRSTRAAAILLLVVSASYLAIISSAQSKLAWYLAPLFPLFAIGVGLGVHAACELARRHAPAGVPVGRFVATAHAGALFLALATGALVVLSNARTVEWSRSRDTAALQLFAASLSPPPGTTLRIVADGVGHDDSWIPDYTPQESFLAKRLTLAGVDAAVVGSANLDVEPGAWVAWCAASVVVPPVIAGTERLSEGPCRLVVAGGPAPHPSLPASGTHGSLGRDRPTQEAP